MSRPQKIHKPIKGAFNDILVAIAEGNGVEKKQTSVNMVQDYAPVDTEWLLTIEPPSEIFVEHIEAPKFKVQIIIEQGQPNPRVSFKAKWNGAKPKDIEMEWYLKALEFYNNAPKPS